MIVRELLFQILSSGPDETFSGVLGGLVNEILVPLLVKLRNWKIDIILMFQRGSKIGYANMILIRQNYYSIIKGLFMNT